MRKQNIFSVVLILILGCLGCLCLGDFANPDFEYGVLANSQNTFPSQAGNWQTNDVIEVWGDGLNGVDAYSGLNFIELNAVINGSSIYQTISTYPHTRYQISWFMQSRGADSQYIQLLLNGEVVKVFDNTGNSNWVEVDYEFYTAHTLLWTVSLVGYNTNVVGSGNFVDNMHITALSQPFNQNCHSVNPHILDIPVPTPTGSINRRWVRDSPSLLKRKTFN